MKENFEYLVQQKASAFQLEPAADIWESVEAAINKKKKRRGFVFWWILPLVACLIAPFFLMDNIELKKGSNINKFAPLTIEHNTIANNATTNKDQQKNNSYTKTITKQSNIIINTNTTTTTALALPLKKDITAALSIAKKTTFNTHALSAQSTAAPIIKTNPPENKAAFPEKPILKQLDPVVQQEVINIAEVVFEPKQEEKIVLADTVAAKKDPIIGEVNSNTPKTADTTITKDSKTLTKNKKKLQPYMLIAGGIANYTATTNTNGMSFAANTTGGWTNSGITTINNNQFSAKGYYLCIGAGVAYALSNKLLLLTQLQYSFVERNLNISSSKDSAITYYYPGTSKTVHNQLHQLVIQQGLQLHNNNNKILRLIKPAIGYQFKTTISSNWLAADYWNAAYSNNYSTVNTIGLSVYAAIWFPVFKGWESGIQYTQDITPISKYQQTSIAGNYFGLIIKKSLTLIFNTSK